MRDARDVPGPPPLSPVRVERERACDALVLGRGEKASAYAGLVVEVAVRSARRPVLAAAVGMARRSGISAIPSLWAIGKDGKVIARDVPPEELDKVVAEAMK